MCTPGSGTCAFNETGEVLLIKRAVLAGPVRVCYHGDSRPAGATRAPTVRVWACVLITLLAHLRGGDGMPAVRTAPQERHGRHGRQGEIMALAHPVYVVRDLVKTYKSGKVRANDGLSFDLWPGEIFGLLGPNGAGKTTLVGQLTGLLRPDSGTLLLYGQDISRDSRFATEAVAILSQLAARAASRNICIAAISSGV